MPLPASRALLSSSPSVHRTFPPSFLPLFSFSHFINRLRPLSGQFHLALSQSHHIITQSRMTKSVWPMSAAGRKVTWRRLAATRKMSQAQCGHVPNIYEENSQFDWHNPQKGLELHPTRKRNGTLLLLVVNKQYPLFPSKKVASNAFIQPQVSISKTFKNKNVDGSKSRTKK